MNLELLKEISGELQKQVKYNREQAIQSKDNEQLPRRYSFDDVGNAKRFTNFINGNFIYTKGEWLKYNSNLGKWESDETYQIELTAQIFVDKKLKEEEPAWESYENGAFIRDFQKHLKKSRSAKCISSMINLTKSRVAVKREIFNKDIMKLNCKDCVIDLNTGKKMPHDKNFYMTQNANVNFPVNAPKPEKWLNFLNEIFMGDKELIYYVQKALGYCLSGLTGEQCIFFAYGGGSNGKSTFMEIIQEIWGDYSKTTPGETLAFSRSKTGATATPELAFLEGARLVLVNETEEGVRLSESLIKQVADDKTYITVRKLYGEPYSYKPTFKLWLLSNHKPKVIGTDNGIWRRLKVIPFMAYFDDAHRDLKIKSKLLAEKDGIFSWILDGLKLYLKEGLDVPESVKNAIDDYRDEMDTIKNFIDSGYIIFHSKYSEKCSSIYERYKQWAKDNGEYIMTSRKFNAEFSKHFDKVRKKDNNYYIGVQNNNHICII